MTPTNFFLFNRNMNCQIEKLQFDGFRAPNGALTMDSQQGNCHGGKPDIKGTHLRAFLTHKFLERKNREREGGSN
jgi:hypothetical protein